MTAQQLVGLLAERATGLLPGLLLRVRRLVTFQEPGALAGTSISAVLFLSLLAYAADDHLATVAAVLIWTAGTVLGLWNFLGSTEQIEREAEDCRAISKLARQQRAATQHGSIPSVTRELSALKQEFEHNFGMDLLRERESVAIAHDIYMEAQHRRFSNPAMLVDQLETGRPELMRVLRLAQVQALRAGILCTFIGLLMGLHNFSLSSAPGQQQVAELMAGLQRGFGASIAGLLVAVWAGFLAQQLAGRQAALRAALHRVAADLIDIVSRAAQSDEFYREVPQVIEAMRELRKDIGQSLHDCQLELTTASVAFAGVPRRWDELVRLTSEHAERLVKVQVETATTLNRQAATFEQLAGRTDEALSSMVAAMEKQADSIRTIGTGLATEVRASYSDEVMRRIQDEAVSRASVILTTTAEHVRSLDERIGILQQTIERGTLLLSGLLAASILTGSTVVISLLAWWVQ